MKMITYRDFFEIIIEVFLNDLEYLINELQTY